MNLKNWFRAMLVIQIHCNMHAHIHMEKTVVSKQCVLLLKLDSLGQRKIMTVVDGAIGREKSLP